jgi:hypothetical protein
MKPFAILQVDSEFLHSLGRKPTFSNQHYGIAEIRFKSKPKLFQHKLAPGSY